MSSAVTSAFAIGALIIGGTLPFAPVPQGGGAPVSVPSSNDAEVETFTEELDREASALQVDPDAASVIGVVWEQSAEETPEVEPQPEIRTRSDGEWSDWEAMELAEGGPDAGTEEAAGAKLATEAYNISGVEAVEVRDAGGDEPDSPGEISLVQTPVTEVDEALTDEGSLEALTDEGFVTEGSSANADYAPAEGLSGSEGFTAQNAAVSRPAIITRSGWGANESLKNCEPDVNSNPALGITIHHTAGSNSYSEAAVPGILRGILSYHTNGQGWCDIGYNFLIDRFGNIYEGRSGGIDRAVIGAHAGGFNARTVGVSVLGTYSSTQVSTAARNAVSRFVAWKANQWAMNPTGKVTLTSNGSTRYANGTRVELNTVFGHRDVSTTDCPGTAFYGQLGSIRSSAASIINDATPTTSGAIRTYLNNNTAIARKLGSPTTHERRLAKDDGSYQDFENGSVHWSKSTGARATFGAIRGRWRALGWENGKLGYPTSNETCGLASSGCYQSFQGGSVHWTSSTGAQATWGAIRTKWRNLGWENSALGYPTAGERTGLKNGGVLQNFQGGVMYWTNATGAHPTKGAIRAAWGNTSWENGRLGYPTSDEYVREGVTWQDFQGGRISWQSGRGAQIHYS